MNWLSKSPPGWASSTGLLVVRVVVGSAFMFHGWPKIHNPTDWMNGMPDAPPGFLQAVAAWIEFAGGALLILGLFERIAAGLLVLQMIAAFVLVHIPHGDPFVGEPGKPSAELACAYLAVSFLGAILGPGLFSLDAMIFGPRSEAAIESSFRQPPAEPKVAVAS